ncbi:UNVERIFIED_CONTAM: hypothetical protein FKN15_005202 [Acipenser sinensis]
MRLANTASLLMAYLDGILRSELHPEPVASDLHLVSARRQLWLSQARAPDVDKSALLDAPISPCHTFRPAVKEILQRSHREWEVSQQVAVILPSHALVRDRMRRWRPPVTTVTQTVPIPTAPHGDLRHRLQASAAANTQGHPQGWGNARRGTPTHLPSGIQFPRNRPRQPPRQAPPQPQQPQ